MAVKFSNNAVTTLSAGISVGATSFTVASASTFPTLGASDWTYVSLTSEVVKVTAISGTTFTCDATSGAHSSGATVELRMTSELLNDVALGDDESLDAISNASAITGNAVDIFIYDTSNDSDGGAWRKRTQATSWYNETLNTATRGSRKEFPSVAVIVATSTAVTIYDGDTPDLDMWMVFTSGSSSFLDLQGTVGVTSISMLNSALCIGKGGTDQWYDGLRVVGFLDDTKSRYNSASYTTPYAGISYTGIVKRNSQRFGYSTVLPFLVNMAVNDVAVTVLPNAPIDSTTGLPIPTILVVTNAGTSVIKDDGTVANSVHISNIDSCYITDDYRAVFSRQPSSGVGFYSGPSLIGLASGWSIIDRFQYDQATSPGFLGGATNPVIAGLNHGSNTGLVLIEENPTTPAKGSVAYLTSTYNSGYMTGDIKGAWLSDTDTTNVVGTELVTNGDFSSGTTGWTAANSSTTISEASGQLTITSLGTGSHYGVASTPISLTEGKTYVLTFTLVSIGGTTPYYTRIGTNNGASTTAANTDIVGSGGITTTGTHSITFVATASQASNTHITFGARDDGTSQVFDNISIRLADSDRSVNNNGLQVNGTITKTAVATGADLVAYSGFSAANYLFIDKSDIGVNWSNAWSLMFWQPNIALNIGIETGVSTGGYDTSVFSWLSETSGGYHPRSKYFSNISETSAGKFVAVVYDGSGGWVVYMDGIQAATRTGTITEGVNTCNINVGRNSYNGTYVAYAGNAASLLRISATAPTAAQILEIYNAEKPLFQENAKATLNGTSDAVQCLAYDDSTELLHVGTSGGRSTFQGLRRVDETATNTTEISAQGGMIIEETA